jgi:hypothetical protein
MMPDDDFQFFFFCSRELAHTIHSASEPAAATKLTEMGKIIIFPPHQKHTPKKRGGG